MSSRSLSAFVVVTCAAGLALAEGEKKPIFPTLPPLAPRAAAPSAPARQTGVSGVVNLNTATETELRCLPGIGPAKAARIMAERAKRRFVSPDQIMRVKGIGRGTYRKLKPHLAVIGPTTIQRERKARTRHAEAPGGPSPQASDSAVAPAPVSAPAAG